MNEQLNESFAQLSEVRLQPRKTVVDGGTKKTVQETLARHALHVENPCGFGYFTGFLLSRPCKKPTFVVPNPPSPPYQGGIEWKVPLIREI